VRHQKRVKKKVYPLSAISRMNETRYAVPIDQLRSSGKELMIMRAQRVLTMTARECWYLRREIADYLRKDPASVSGYLRGEDLRTDVKKVILMLGEGELNGRVKGRRVTVSIPLAVSAVSSFVPI